VALGRDVHPPVKKQALHKCMLFGLWLTFSRGSLFPDCSRRYKVEGFPQAPAATLRYCVSSQPTTTHPFDRLLERHQSGLLLQADWKCWQASSRGVEQGIHP
jgi:hypothetical protein